MFHTTGLDRITLHIYHRSVFSNIPSYGERLRGSLMGGINHQPCGSGLKRSVRLSRAVSVAYAKFMEANATLEDALIGELDGVSPVQSLGAWEHARDELGGLVTLLDHVVEAFTASIDDMEAHPFLHGAILQSLDLARLGNGLWKADAVNIGDPIFIEIGTELKNGGFERVFRDLKQRFVAHRSAAQRILETFEAGERYAREGTLLRMIEQNELPFRLDFARLMNPFTRTMQMFSYSSLISIEVHYRSTHCKAGTSLLQSEAARP